MIKPTVGRKVWFWPNAYFQTGPNAMSASSKQPLDATIVFVHGDRMVNLVVFDSNGKMFPVTSMTLKQEGDELAEGMAYAEWMPYQINQAAKESVAS